MNNSVIDDITNLGANNSHQNKECATSTDYREKGTVSLQPSSLISSLSLMKIDPLTLKSQNILHIIRCNGDIPKSYPQSFGTRVTSQHFEAPRIALQRLLSAAFMFPIGFTRFARAAVSKHLLRTDGRRRSLSFYLPCGVWGSPHLYRVHLVDVAIHVGSECDRAGGVL